MNTHAKAGLSYRHLPCGTNTRFMGEGQPFAEYVLHTQEMLHRVHAEKTDRDKIVSGNSPFGLHPGGNFQKGRDKPYRRGVLLTHGLSDSPYHMRHLADFFQRNGFRVMAVLLPGHGTRPGDLLDVRWQEWAKTVAYGTRCLADEADEIYLAGFSAGGALSVLHASRDERVRGLFLFSPALEITSRARWANWHKLYSWLAPRAAWVSVMPDTDFYKYESFCKNAAAQMYALTQTLPQCGINIPVFAVASADDATVHSSATLHFMRCAKHPASKLVWYARGGFPLMERLAIRLSGKAAKSLVIPPGEGLRVGEHALNNMEWVNSAVPEQRILSSAHTAIVVPPEDTHYGAGGEYANCLHYFENDKERYAACLSPLQQVYQGEVNRQNLGRGVLRRLMYNPHYAAMETSMQKFIESLP